MVRFTKGNILDAETEAIVNTVNTVGVMGKGIALMFKQAYPDNFQQYSNAVKRNEIGIGRVLPVETGNLMGPKWILNFPTKKHWRQPSQLEWIESGLHDLIRTIERLGIRSVAVPPLGCGAGGLEWDSVRPMIERILGDVQDLDVVIYEPTQTYQNTSRPAGVEKLTFARASVADLVRRYEVLGFDCTNLEIQKLAWFLEQSLCRLGLPALDLQFKPARYGPYSDRLRHVLDALDGTYLLAEKRLADAGPNDLIRFNRTNGAPLDNYLHTEVSSRQTSALDMTARIIEGFESPLGMELLATVHWLLINRNLPSTVEAIQNELPRWPGNADAGARKVRLFPPRLVEIAISRLQTAALINAPAA
jgi:O-acetyl-ADP-ribose deacetylase (regulator of RNase III)